MNIPTAIWQQPVEGLNLQPGSLANQLTPHQPTLLVFLRHFG